MKSKYTCTGKTMFLKLILSMAFLTACGNTNELPQADVVQTTHINESDIQTEEEETIMNERNQTNLLGGLSPADALEYMKNTENLVIVEVNTEEWKKAVPFIGAMWIPHDEMSERYDEIPSGRPVLLHCGGGIVSVPAYEVLKEMRKDIPELSYIAGAPPIQAYNEWLKEQ